MLARREKFSLLIGVVDAQGLLAENGAGRSSSTTTAAAGLPAIPLLIGAVGVAPFLGSSLDGMEHPSFWYDGRSVHTRAF